MTYRAGCFSALEPEVGVGLCDPVLAVVVDRGRDALLERRPAPAELLDRAARVEQDRVGVVRDSGRAPRPRARGSSRERATVASKSSLIAKSRAGGDVIGAARPSPSIAFDHAVDQVVDEDEVAPRVHDEAGLPVVRRWKKVGSGPLTLRGP